MGFGLDLLFLIGLFSLISKMHSFKIPEPNVTDNNGTLPILCYFSMDPSWPDDRNMHPALNATLCTHILMIGIGLKNCRIYVSSDIVKKYFNKMTLLRKQNPNLKLIVSNTGGGSKDFVTVLGSRDNRTIFTKSAVPFMKRFDFDGLDIDWEFPGWPTAPVDQQRNFTMLMQELREEFDRESTRGKHFTLSAAVAPERILIHIYDIPALAKCLDFINLMCYDFRYYALYDPLTGYNSPLYPKTWMQRPVILFGNIGWSTNEWWKRGMPKSKIMVGLPTYGHIWTLEQPKKYHGLNAPATGPGHIGSYGSYPWICKFLKSAHVHEKWDDDAAVPYAYMGDQWVSYDNVHSMKSKADWIKQNGFGGIMIFSMNADDYLGSCGEGKFPLISAIHRALHNRSRQTRHG